MKSTKINFTDIPSWTYEGNTPSVHTFFAAIALAGYENHRIRLSAALQRDLLGAYVLGKQEIVLTERSTLYVRSSTGFGTDFHEEEVGIDRLRKAIESGKVIRAGWSGKKYG